MAIFGDLGKILGLGTAQETVTAVTGSPILGRTAGVVSRGVSGLSNRTTATEQGQAVAVSQATQTLPQESQQSGTCLLYTSPSPRDRTRSRMPSSA